MHTLVPAAHYQNMPSLELLIMHAIVDIAMQVHAIIYTLKYNASASTALQHNRPHTVLATTAIKYTVTSTSTGRTCTHAGA
jgi:hypothetical protein